MPPRNEFISRFHGKSAQKRHGLRISASTVVTVMLFVGGGAAFNAATSSESVRLSALGHAVAARNVIESTTLSVAHALVGANEALTDGLAEAPLKLARNVISIFEPILNSFAAFARDGHSIATRAQLAAAGLPSFNGAAEHVYRWLCPLFTGCDEQYIQQEPRKTPATPPRGSPIGLVAPSATTTAAALPEPAAIQRPAPRDTGTKVIERVVSGGGITEAILAGRIESLRSDLLGKIAAVAASVVSHPVPAPSNPAVAAGGNSVVYTSAPAAGRIDKLDAVTITNPTITGGSVAAASISGTIGNAIASIVGTIDTLTSTTLTATNATFTNSTTTNATSTTLAIFTPPMAPAYTATSTTATSTFASGGVSVGTSSPSATSLLTVGTSSPLFYIDRTTGKVGIGTSAPSASAALQIDSTSSAFLPPRLTTAQKTAISSPASGLVLYDSDLNKLNVYNGSGWKNVGSTEIGGEVTSGTTGSVLFIGDGTVLGQDNANFSYATSTNRLLTTQASTTRLSVFDRIYIGGTATSTIRGDGAASSLPYASTTALSVSGTLYSDTASTSNLTISNLASGGLAVNTTGGVYKAATTTFSSGLTYANGNVTLDWLFPSNSTTTALTFSSGFTSSGQTTLAQASSTLFSNIGTAYFGGTSTTTISNVGSVTLPATALLTAPYASSTALTISGTGYFGTASSSNLTISNIQSSLLKTGSTGVVAAAVAGTDYVTGAGLAAAYPFALSGNATSTLTQFNGGFTAYASSTVGGATAASGLTVSGTATSTNLAITGVTSALLKTNSLGQVAAAVSGTDYAPGNITWPFSPATSFGSAAQSTSTALLLTGGLHASSTVRFGNAGLDQFLWDASLGGLGIGTTTPAFTLQLASSTKPQLALSDGSASSNAWTLRSTGNTLYLATSSPSTFATSTVPALTVTTNGFLGIGTTTPGTLFSLQGTANFAAFATTSIYNGLLIANTGGNVGIGTTTPSAKLTVYGDAFLEGSSRYLSFGTVQGTSGYGFRDNAGTLEFKNSGGSWQGVTTATSGPSFLAHRNGTATTTQDAVLTIPMDWTNEDFDTNNNFDLTTERFTPTVPGKYIMTFQFRCNEADGSFCGAHVFKNGASIAQGYQEGDASSPISSVTTIVDMNGATDYLQAVPYVDVPSGSADITGSAGMTFFTGALIAPVSATAGGWQNDGTQSFLADSTDKVGIGTSTPWAKLSIDAPAGVNSFAIGSSTATYFLVNTSGNVGIGTTSPSTLLHLNASSGNGLRIDTSGGTVKANFITGETSAAIGTISNHNFTIDTNNTTRMTIDTSGIVSIGTVNTAALLNVDTTANQTKVFIKNYGSGFGYGVVMQPQTDTGGPTPFLFENAAGTGVGSISTNGSATAYNTSSDRRIKANIATTTLGLDALMRLSVRDFSFKSDATHATTSGFIAQELYNIFPWAVTTNGDNGTDPLAASSSPWAIDYGRITPLLAKSIQDLNLKLEDLATTTASNTDQSNFTGRFFASLFARLSQWFADATNGIENFFAQIGNFGRVNTDQLCTTRSDGSEVCASGDQLAAILAGTSTGAPVSSGDVGGAPASSSAEGGIEADVGMATTTETVDGVPHVTPDHNEPAAGAPSLVSETEAPSGSSAQGETNADADQVSLPTDGDPVPEDTPSPSPDASPTTEAGTDAI